MPRKNDNGDWIVPKRIIWGFITAIVFLLFTTAWGWKDDLGAEKLKNVRMEIEVVGQKVGGMEPRVTANTEFRIDTNRRLQNIEQRLNAIAKKLGITDP